MITLITGQPGSGKTLYALSVLLAESAKLTAAGRQVFIDGVAGLTRQDWYPIEGAEWMAAPDGSMVFLDECQRIFRPRGNGSQVPAHVAALETHRHRGFDFIIVTQHPKLVDANVRRLCGRHLHVKRSFGMQRATIHEWGEVNLDPDQSRTDSIRHEFSYPKEVFALYKSAEIHTHKRRIPPRLFFLLLLPLLLAGIVYAMWSTWFAPRVSGTYNPITPQAEKSPSKTASPSGGTPKSSDKLTPAEWVDQRQARIDGMPWTAPVYDSVTAPAYAPAPVACISSSSECSCYSQQGTRLSVSGGLCRSIVSGGFFTDWVDNSPRYVPVPLPESNSHKVESSAPILKASLPLQNGVAP